MATSRCKWKKWNGLVDITNIEQLLTYFVHNSLAVLLDKAEKA